MDQTPKNSTLQTPLLDVRQLRTEFKTEQGVLKAVHGAEFSLKPGEIFGLVGESGSGKTVTALSILRLVLPPGKIAGGEIIFDGESVLDLSEVEMRQLRGRRISMVFQQPHSSLNPVFSIGSMIAEIYQLHQNQSRRESWDAAVDLLGRVGIPDPEIKAHSYPHEISGGQAQRVTIAAALALNPQLLIADEPTSALDVTVQAQILALIRKLARTKGTAVILITHDLGVVAKVCDRVAVMYAGHILEEAEVSKLLRRPLHPYTQGLIASIPNLSEVRDRLKGIPGAIPDMTEIPVGCRFAPRCEAKDRWGLEICEQKLPGNQPVSSDHTVRCWLYSNNDDHSAPLEIGVDGVSVRTPTP